MDRGDAPFPADGDWDRPMPGLVRLRDRLRALDFGATARLPYAGGPLDAILDPAAIAAYRRGAPNLFHRSAAPAAYRRRLARTHPGAVAAHELLTLGRVAGRGAVDAAVGGELVGELLATGVLESWEGGVRANVLAVPSAGALILADPVRLQDRPDYVYAGRSSSTAAEQLAALGWRVPAGAPGAPRRLLDLGCGAGFAAVAAGAAGVEEVVGADIVDRCLRFARLNAALNGVADARFVRSDVFSGVSGDFDLIVCNAPCVWDELQQAVYATGGGAYGTELPVRMISGSLDHLRPDGLLVVVMSAPLIRGRRPLVVDALGRAFGDRQVAAEVVPLISEYEFAQAPVLRRHGISEYVRYLVTVTPSDRRSIRLRRAEDLRTRLYRARAATVRMAAGLARPGRPGGTLRRRGSAARA